MILGQKGGPNNQRQRRRNNDQCDEETGARDTRVREHDGSHTQLRHHVQGDGLDDTEQSTKRDERAVQEDMQTDEKEEENVHVRERANRDETGNEAQEAGIYDEGGYKDGGRIEPVECLQQRGRRRREWHRSKSRTGREGCGSVRVLRGQREPTGYRSTNERHTVASFRSSVISST